MRRCVTPISKEWSLYRDNSVNLRFIYTRRYRIHLSLGVFPEYTVELTGGGGEIGVGLVELYEVP